MIKHKNNNNNKRGGGGVLIGGRTPIKLHASMATATTFAVRPTTTTTTKPLARCYIAELASARLEWRPEWSNKCKKALHCNFLPSKIVAHSTISQIKNFQSPGSQTGIIKRCVEVHDINHHPQYSMASQELNCPWPM